MSINFKHAALVSQLTHLCGRALGEWELRDLLSLVVSAESDPLVVSDLMRAIHLNRKIEAIKAHRTLTNFGLKESKDAVEAAMSGT